MICLLPQFCLPHTQDHNTHSILACLPFPDIMLRFALPGTSLKLLPCCWSFSGHRSDIPPLLLPSTWWPCWLVLLWLLRAVLLQVFALPPKQRQGKSGCSCVSCFPKWLQFHVPTKKLPNPFSTFSVNTWNWSFVLYPFCGHQKWSNRRPGLQRPWRHPQEETSEAKKYLWALTTGWECKVTEAYSQNVDALSCMFTV